MGYCTITDVEAQLSSLPSFSDAPTATVPTLTQVTAMVANVSNELNGLLRSKGYVLPVTDSEALNYLQTVAIYGVCGLVLQAAFMGDNAVGAGADVWFGLYGEAKKAIVAGALGIDDTKDTGSFASGFSADADGKPFKPFMTRDWQF